MLGCYGARVSRKPQEFITEGWRCGVCLVLRKRRLIGLLAALVLESYLMRTMWSPPVHIQRLRAVESAPIKPCALAGSVAVCGLPDLADPPNAARSPFSRFGALKVVGIAPVVEALLVAMQARPNNSPPPGPQQNNRRHSTACYARRPTVRSWRGQGCRIAGTEGAPPPDVDQRTTSRRDSLATHQYRASMNNIHLLEHIARQS